MSLNPLNELKRRLEDNSTPLPKRLCLAKNVVQSHHFPTAPKERIIAEWLNSLTNKNELVAQELRSVLEWLNMGYDLSNELKVKLIQVTSQYLQRNPLQSEDIHHIIKFLDNDKITTQLSSQISEYLLIIVTLLQNLKTEDNINTQLCEKIFTNLIKYYKESKKKLEFIIKLIEGENLETIFSFLETSCRTAVINVCQHILFPTTKKSFFINFLQTLIVKDNIDDLIAEKGDNIQSVLKIMSAFFTFPKGRTQKDPQFLRDFADVFVSSYRNESQVIFAFYIMVTNSLSMDQSYMNPAMKMPPIIFEANDDKIKRNLFLNLLEILHKNEVDIRVRLTDTFGEKVSKVEIKKSFSSFIQAVLMAQLKLQGKLDKTTLKIIKVALRLDPMLIEQKLHDILPPLMAAKKNNSTINIYTETLNCLLETLFKLSRGVQFLNQILPAIKINLEASNTEQFELKQQLKESTDNTEIEKLNAKIINGNDVFPEDSVKLYGKLTSELMFRQSKDILLLIQKDLEEHCLMMLEEGFVSPSIITLTEILSSILSSVIDHNKMADHTVPAQIADDFWKSYQKFEDECLNKFGQCVLRLSYNPLLAKAFLNLCRSFARLKLFNLNYSHTKLSLPPAAESSELFDFSCILTCMGREDWLELVGKVGDDDVVAVLDDLLLIKSMYTELLSRNQEITKDENITTHLIKRITTNSDMLQQNYFSRVLFNDLEASQFKQLAKTLVKMQINDQSVLENDSVKNNKQLLSVIVLEVCKNLTKNFNNTESLTKSLNKSSFDIESFIKDVNVKELLQEVAFNSDYTDEIVTNYIEMLKQSKVYYLEENYQLTAILVLLLLKKCCQSKKMRKSIDAILLSIFELSPKCPNIYKIFPVETIFSFDDNLILDLLTLKIKTSNQTFIIRTILEFAVKKVKTDSDLVKNIVKLILKNKKKQKGITNTDVFKDSVFQISCTILPIIAKEKRAITASAYRSILADLQEKLHKDMLESFKVIDFGNGSLFVNASGNTDDSVVISDNLAGVLNAMGSFSLTLAKYCESTDSEEIKNLDCLWSGLEFFVENAINSIQDPNSKNQHIDASLQLIIAILRYIKKLEAHPIFNNKDKLFLKIWNCIKLRITQIYREESDKNKRVNDGILENVAIVLKFVCELSSVECFVNNFVADLTSLASLKKPSQIVKEVNTPNSILPAHKTSKYLWTQCLKANIIGPKCVAMTKLMLQSCNNLHLFIQQHYEFEQCSRVEKTTKMVESEIDDGNVVKIVTVDDAVCELLRVDLDTLSQAILAGKKITLDFKFVDSIFEVQHLIHYILGGRDKVKVDISWESYFKLYLSSVSLLNSLLVSREELLEDRWPNYMQCYRSLISSLCERDAADVEVDRNIREKLAEIAHCMEKLTQSISKRKKQVSRIAAYTVADICFHIEKFTPSRNIRQHLENSIALLIQASDSTYAMAFLKRCLAGAPGQMTMTNMYTMYKRYHKYVGNA